jgi:protein-L-isoaspartate(D-aspartate) O-methyltransferase
MDDALLLDAFRAIPRAEFVPEDLRHLAYQDRPVPISHDQVTTQPSLSAMMIEALEVASSSRVLEVGTGLGFQTALLARLAERVVTIEVWKDLAGEARANLDAQRIANVETHVGDGTLGVPGAAPFDAVLVSAAFPEVPDPLAEQLVEGGRLVQPIGSGGNEMVTLFRKTGGTLERVRPITPARFVRLVGREAFPPEER